MFVRLKIFIEIENVLNTQDTQPSVTVPGTQIDANRLFIFKGSPTEIYIIFRNINDFNEIKNYFVASPIWDRMHILVCRSWCCKASKSTFTVPSHEVYDSRFTCQPKRSLLMPRRYLNIQRPSELRSFTSSVPEFACNWGSLVEIKKRSF